jgi:uncharacterized membrane protein YcaP (DUF421 family)
MNYPSMISAIPWQAVLLSMVQTFIIYWLVLLGLKRIGKRIFGELSPQDLIILLLIAEGASAGLVNQDAGFWGAIGSILTILTLGAVIERVSWLRNYLEEEAVVLVKNGRPLYPVMDKNFVQIEELEKAARDYGFNHFDAFETMVLESDGQITAVLKPEYRPVIRKDAQTKRNAG